MKTMFGAMTMVPFLAAVGCAHSGQIVKEPLETSAAQTQPTSVVSQAAIPGPTVCGSDLDCQSGQICISDRCQAVSAELAACSSLRVHFAFASSDLDAVDRTSLERGARCLEANHALHVTVEGNADERGTEEYNLALGDRRADGVARYLEALGASKAQLKTVSYGKENPLCAEHDEACWMKNRRADLKLASAKSQ